MTTFALAVLAASTFQPPRLAHVKLDPVPYGARAAGVVAVEASVSATGSVDGVRTIKSVEPFTPLMTGGVGSWTFEPARDGDQPVACHQLVLGIFRPAMLLYPAPPPPEQKDYPLSDDVPRPTKWSMPPYPPTATAGDAIVVVEVEVDDGGAVTGTRVLTSVPGFDDAALGAARQWAFKPATRANRSAPSRVIMAFYFRQPL
jgi:TonB family protein